MFIITIIFIFFPKDGEEFGTTASFLTAGCKHAAKTALVCGAVELVLVIRY